MKKIFSTLILLSIACLCCPLLSSQESADFNGSYKGTYFYPDGRPSVIFDLQLRYIKTNNILRGSTVEPNTFNNNGGILQANISGSSIGRNFRFTKTYDGSNGASHSVFYKGVLSENSQRLEGYWNVGDYSGYFSAIKTDIFKDDRDRKTLTIRSGASPSGHYIPQTKKEQSIVKIVAAMVVQGINQSQQQITENDSLWDKLFKTNNAKIAARKRDKIIDATLAEFLPELSKKQRTHLRIVIIKVAEKKIPGIITEEMVRQELSRPGIDNLLQQQIFVSFIYDIARLYSRQTQ